MPDIPYGFPLHRCCHAAQAAVPGSFVYDPPLGTGQDGTVLDAGDHDVTVTFTPTDAANYQTVTRTIRVHVTKATVRLRWTQPATTYGQKADNVDVDAYYCSPMVSDCGEVEVPGTFTFDPAQGAYLPAGATPVHVTFTPSNTTNFTSAVYDGHYVVAKAPLTVSAPSIVLTYPAAAPASLVPVVQGFVRGETAAVLTSPPACGIVYTGPTPIPAGVYPIRCSGAAAANYAMSYVDGTATVRGATTTALAATPSPSLVGQAVSLTATVTSPAALGPAKPGGLVTFTDGTTSLGTASVARETARPCSSGATSPAAPTP